MLRNPNRVAGCCSWLYRLHTGGRPLTQRVWAKVQQPLSVPPLAERLEALFAGKWVMVILPNSLPLRRSREAWWPWLALQLIKHLIHD